MLSSGMLAEAGEHLGTRSERRYGKMHFAGHRDF
jgi:hypothetical protein